MKTNSTFPRRLAVAAVLLVVASGSFAQKNIEAAFASFKSEKAVTISESRSRETYTGNIYNASGSDGLNGNALNVLISRSIPVRKTSSTSCVRLSTATAMPRIMNFLTRATAVLHSRS